MTSAEFGWQALLHTDAPSACKLKAALFTTYDRADERLLVEHLLPLFLKLGHEPDGEGAERQYFLLELDRRLKQLHDHLVVVSSTAREEPGDADQGESGAYGWIWRCIRHLTVGSRGKAVQHAKLWLLHWGAAVADGVEYLEIVVSSANLTRAAFKGQLQAAWRARIHLHPQRLEERLKRWGVLPDFLRELAASAGEDGRLDSFVELLARGDRPEGVTFIASVPGTHSRQVLRGTPWGAAGLREITPPGRGTVSGAILCPFVGSWSADALKRWCASFEGLPHRLALVWIDKNHPWAHAAKWILPESTLKTLTELDASLLKLRHEADDPEGTDRFHEEHRPTHGDDRWSHSKVYCLRRGNSRRLLVTSANFSPAAWGRQNSDGDLTIENFELGVCVEQAAWPFDDLEPLDGAFVSELPGRGSAFIMWARAVWDGKTVDVDCRCEPNRELVGALQSGGEWTPIATWTVDADGCFRSARVLWADATRPPLLVQLTCEQETVSVAVFDARPARDREDTIPPEVDKDAAQWMRDELLFEQYGGYVAADAEGEALTNGGKDLAEDDGDGAGPTDSYTVPAFVLARRHLGVVDNWADQAKRASARGAEEFERRLLLRDGEMLIDAFRRQADRDGKKESAWAIGAKLAAEELTQRLKHFREA
jgi:Tyrosyl-DNA phosphodiesterase